MHFIKFSQQKIQIDIIPPSVALSVYNINMFTVKKFTNYYNNELHRSTSIFPFSFMTNPFIQTQQMNVR